MLKPPKNPALKDGDDEMPNELALRLNFSTLKNTREATHPLTGWLRQNKRARVPSNRYR